jgi:hypothetical protein
MEPNLSLCVICLGINENTVTVNRSSAFPTVYKHQPSLLALELSAINGCVLCKLAFDGLRKNEEVSDIDLRLALALTASADCSLPYDEEGEAYEIATTDILNLQVDESPKPIYTDEDLSSCTPLLFTITGTIKDGTARIVCLSTPPPLGSLPGQIFVSRGSKEPFQTLDFVVSGRSIRGILQSPLETSIQVFTTRSMFD